MRVIKLFLAVLIIQLTISCDSDSLPEPSLAGKWKIISGVGNNDRHWTGSLTLQQNNENYTGQFIWDSLDGEQSGTDSIAGKYNAKTKVLVMTSVVISGNIEPVVYTMDVSGNGTIMKGMWTGSSDGSIEDPGLWTAQKE